MVPWDFSLGGQCNPFLRRARGMLERRRVLGHLTTRLTSGPGRRPGLLQYCGPPKTYMATITGKQGEWTVPHAHAWSERGRDLRFDRIPLIGRETKVVILGACISVSLAAGLRRLGFRVSTHPAGHLYDAPSIRQAVEHVLGGWPERDHEPVWEVKGGFMDPFAKSYLEVCESRELLLKRRDQRDKLAREMFAKADVVAVFVEMIESWRSSSTGNYFLCMPHPQVFPHLGAQLHRLRFADVTEELERIRRAVGQTKARLVIASSASWQDVTVTSKDVRSASLDGVARVHAAVSEFVETHPDVHYFPLSEMLFTAERPTDFWGPDGRHIHPKAGDYILQQFLRRFGADSVEVPELDLSWLHDPGASSVPASAQPRAIPSTPPPSPWQGRLSRLKTVVRKYAPEWMLERYRRASLF